MFICSVQEAGVFLGVYVPMKEGSIMGNILCSVAPKQCQLIRDLGHFSKRDDSHCQTFIYFGKLENTVVGKYASFNPI